MGRFFLQGAFRKREICIAFSKLNALREAVNAAFEGLVDADAADLLLSDKEWEAKNLEAMGAH